jgi:hypothetical protein
MPQGAEDQVAGECVPSRPCNRYSFQWQQADWAHAFRFHPEILLTENIVFRKRNSGDRGGTQTEVLLRHLNGKPPQPLIQRELYELAALEER